MSLNSLLTGFMWNWTFHVNKGDKKNQLNYNSKLYLNCQMDNLDKKNYNLSTVR